LVYNCNAISIIFLCYCIDVYFCQVGTAGNWVSQYNIKIDIRNNNVNTETSNSARQFYSELVKNSDEIY